MSMTDDQFAELERQLDEGRDPRTRAVAAALSGAAIRPGVTYTDEGVASFIADLRARGYEVKPNESVKPADQSAEGAAGGSA